MKRLGVSRENVQSWRKRSRKIMGASGKPSLSTWKTAIKLMYLLRFCYNTVLKQHFLDQIQNLICIYIYILLYQQQSCEIISIHSRVLC